MKTYKSPYITIVIATYNRHNELECALDSIEKKISIKSQIEVIVVDQSETIFTPNKCYSYDLIICSNEVGASSSRNAGAKRALGKYIYFMDDDSVIVEFNSETFLSSKSDVVFMDWIEKPSKLYQGRIFRKINILRKSGTPFYILTRNLFNRVGGFTESIGPGTKIIASEDLDLLLRVDSRVKIERFICIGAISHPLPNKLDEMKVNLYQQSRGFVLLKHKQYYLIFIELILSLYLAALKRDNRIKNIINGIRLKWQG